MFREGVQDNKQKIVTLRYPLKLSILRKILKKILLPSHKTILNWIFKDNKSVY